VSVDYQVSSGVATITLARPERRNALSVELLEDLLDRLAASAADGSVRAVVLAGAGPVFCAGADLGSVTARPGELTGTLAAVLRAILAHRCPVVARAQGATRAGGMGLLGASDVVVAASDATFGFPEVRLGVSPAVIAAVLGPRLEATAAQRYLLTADNFDAAEAQRIGLVSVVVSPEQLDAAVSDVVSSLLLGAPESLARTKAALLALRGRPTEEDWRLATEVSAALFASDDAREGLAARKEGRLPRWATSQSPGE
jgi:methylglutaconyl-CoA hydratase